ncbi:acyltransferase family protein [Oerskovia paurometabola]|uniref:Acyltransferase family protein n=1 Tax=Oerskovia paurometabola TaxID=162170 RepID=A0ABW1XA07_9CELL|nr:acyltransferase family protein [Oerskovia paurometabola]MBM7497872.1 peptidoglycan/LPS O-acetylase OafA/YrhL [Oerskovia paurometabola]
MTTVGQSARAQAGAARTSTDRVDVWQRLRPADLDLDSPDRSLVGPPPQNPPAPDGHRPSRPVRPTVRYRRIAGLDGLRALAVLSVMVFHFAPQVLPGGYVGVDIFFVLSGFLITTLLVREFRARRAVSLSRFWVRRARRLLPALGLVVLVCTAAAGLVGGDLLVGIGAQVAGAATFTSNWVYIAQGSTYSGGLAPQIFANLWSLAVEEQFYLVWPLVVLAVLALRITRRRALVLAGVLAGGSAVAMAFLYSPGTDPTRVYFGTDTHLFGLMIGAFLAFWHLRTGRPTLVRESPRTTTRKGTLFVAATGIAGAVVLVAAMFWMPWDDGFTYRGGLFAVSLATAGVVNLVLHAPGLGKHLDRGPVGWVGARSYGLYLWHWPVFVLAAALAGGGGLYASPGPWVALAATVVTFGAAALSYRYVERPVMGRGLGGYVRTVVAWLRRGASGRNPLPVRGWLTVGGVVVVVGLAVTGFVRAPATSSLEAQIRAGQEVAAQTQQPGGAAAAEPAPEVAPVPAEPAAPQAPAPAVAPTPPPGDQVTIIGDSVTLASAPALTTSLPGVLIDGAVARQMKDAVGLVDAVRAAGNLRPYVVLSLGTNSTVDAAMMDRVLAAIGPDHTVVLVTGYADRSWVPVTNAELVGASQRWGNVVVADWSGAVGAQPALLGPDGVHPTGEGASLYAGVVAGGLTQAAALRGS